MLLTVLPLLLKLLLLQLKLPLPLPFSLPLPSPLPLPLLLPLPLPQAMVVELYWAEAALPAAPPLPPAARTPPVPAAIRPTVRAATTRRRGLARPVAALARDIALSLIWSSSSGLASGRSARMRSAIPSNSGSCFSFLRRISSPRRFRRGKAVIGPYERAIRFPTG